MSDESELDRSDPAGLRWPGFTITGPHPGEISLRQIDPKYFVLERGMTIRYDGATGLEGLDRVDGATIEQIRSLTSAELQRTDLASVPGLLRWFTNTYGLHTPAALIHDWLIGAGKRGDPVIDDRDADRYFRFMLDSVGVPWLKGWIMWAAVALRTRWRSNLFRKLTVVLWGLAATAGLAALVAASVALIGGFDLPNGVDPPLLIVASLAAPFVFSVLWGRQYGAGLVASFVAPWILPPAVFALLGYIVYWVIEVLIPPYGSD
jgi:hypothetical protein